MFDTHLIRGDRLSSLPPFTRFVFEVPATSVTFTVHVSSWDANFQCSFSHHSICGSKSFRCVFFFRRKLFFHFKNRLVAFHLSVCHTAAFLRMTQIGTICFWKRCIFTHDYASCDTTIHGTGDRIHTKQLFKRKMMSALLCGTQSSRK